MASGIYLVTVVAFANGGNCVEKLSEFRNIAMIVIKNKIAILCKITLYIHKVSNSK